MLSRFWAYVYLMNLSFLLFIEQPRVDARHRPVLHSISPWWLLAHWVFDVIFNAVIVRIKCFLDSSLYGCAFSPSCHLVGQIRFANSLEEIVHLFLVAHLNCFIKFSILIRELSLYMRRSCNFISWLLWILSLIRVLDRRRRCPCQHPVLIWLDPCGLVLLV